jgi:hypothetical protein
VRLLVERAGSGVMWRCRSFRSWISARGSAESRLRHRVEAGQGHLTLTPISHFPLSKVSRTYFGFFTLTFSNNVTNLESPFFVDLATSGWLRKCHYTWASKKEYAAVLCKAQFHSRSLGRQLLSSVSCSASAPNMDGAGRRRRREQ